MLIVYRRYSPDAVTCFLRNDSELIRFIELIRSEENPEWRGPYYIVPSYGTDRGPIQYIDTNIMYFPVEIRDVEIGR